MASMDLVELAVRALAFFNVVVLSWLGLTVLFNADRGKPGTWLTAGGLLIGGACSIAHSIVAGPNGWEAGAAPVDWWRLTWLPFAGAPYLWSIVLIWYAGRLRSRWEWLWVLTLSGAGLVVFVLLLALVDLVDLTVSNRFVVGVYLVYATTCLATALAALYRPRGPDRFMGELAARRARPWLTVTSAVSLALGVAVGLALVDPPLAPLPLVDLAGLLLVGLQAVLMGQAIVSYEVFTGKPLPRGGLARHWQRTLILALGLSGLMAVSLAVAIDEMVRVLLAIVVVTIFYALITWRLLAERERSLDRLRPFVASRQLGPGLLGEADADGAVQASAGLIEPFRALCEELLGAGVAHLCSVGSLAPLIGPPLSHPRSLKPPPEECLQEIGQQIVETGRPCLPVDPAESGGASWVVPLWNGPSLGGLLFLGEKHDGSLYTEEEIEIARATGERLIDAQATAELARRLLIVQRRRTAEEQIRDRMSRRALHDDVLPLLHAALLAVGSAPTHDEQPGGDARRYLADAHRRVADLLRELPAAPPPGSTSNGLASALRAAVCELAPSFDSVAWHLPNGDAKDSLALSGLATEVVFGATREAVRNAARHGRGADPARPLHVSIALVVTGRDGEDVQVWIEDNGVGIEAGQRSQSSGQGLVLHGTLVALLGGSLSAERLSQGGTRITIRVPATA